MSSELRLWKKLCLLSINDFSAFRKSLQEAVELWASTQFHYSGAWQGAHIHVHQGGLFGRLPQWSKNCLVNHNSLIFHYFFNSAISSAEVPSTIMSRSSAVSPTTTGGRWTRTTSTTPWLLSMPKASTTSRTSASRPTTRAPRRDPTRLQGSEHLTAKLPPSSGPTFTSTRSWW